MWLQHQHWHRVGYSKFLLGIVIWIAGACTNIHADYHLIHLKRSAPKDAKYPWQIPYQGIFQYVSGVAQVCLFNSTSHACCKLVDCTSTFPFVNRAVHFTTCFFGIPTM